MTLAELVQLHTLWSASDIFRSTFPSCEPQSKLGYCTWWSVVCDRDNRILKSTRLLTTQIHVNVDYPFQNKCQWHNTVMPPTITIPLSPPLPSISPHFLKSEIKGQWRTLKSLVRVAWALDLFALFLSVNAYTTMKYKCPYSSVVERATRIRWLRNNLMVRPAVQSSLRASLLLSIHTFSFAS